MNLGAPSFIKQMLICIKVKVVLNIIIMSYFDSPISYRSAKQITKTRTSVKLYRKSNRLNKYTQNIPPNGYEM